MATIAGDEITEAIMEACLTDFQTAEALKRRLGQEETLKYINILGYDAEISGDALYKQIRPAIEQLVRVVAERVAVTNHKPPAALFLVGGGSQLPNLCAMVAGELGMEENRVAVGGMANMKKQAVSAEQIFGPEFATPLGIAITASRREKDEAFTVTVNQDKVPMLGAWEMTVLDALQLAGYKYSKIMGRAGRMLIFELDGERRSRRGGLPGASVVTRNGQPCALGDKVIPGDLLVFEPAVAGKDAVLTVEEVAGEQKPLALRVNGISYTAGHFTQVNGRPAAPGQLVRSMDAIFHRSIQTVDDLCGDLELNLDLYEIFVNGKKESGAYLLNDEDNVETRLRADKTEAPRQTSRQAPAGAAGKEPSLISLNGAPLYLPAKENDESYYVVDMFSHVDMDLKNPSGTLVLTVNGREASFVQALREGDEVVIRWADD